MSKRAANWESSKESFKGELKEEHRRRASSKILEEEHRAKAPSKSLEDDLLGEKDVEAFSDDAKVLSIRRFFD